MKDTKRKSNSLLFVHIETEWVFFKIILCSAASTVAVIHFDVELQ